MRLVRPERPRPPSSPEERFCAADLKTPLDSLFAVAGMGQFEGVEDKLDRVTAQVAAITASGYGPAAADVAASEEAVGPLEDVLGGPVTTDDLRPLLDGIAAVGEPGIALWERQVRSAEGWTRTGGSCRDPGPSTARRSPRRCLGGAEFGEVGAEAFQQHR